VDDAVGVDQSFEESHGMKPGKPKERSFQAVSIEGMGKLLPRRRGQISRRQ
jgi:hypothetical protein